MVKCYCPGSIVGPALVFLMLRSSCISQMYHFISFWMILSDKEKPRATRTLKTLRHYYWCYSSGLGYQIFSSHSIYRFQTSFHGYRRILCISSNDHPFRSHSPKFQHYRSLTIRLFSIMYRTLVWEGLTPLQWCSQCILQPG